MKELVKIGFCVAYDWYLLEYSLPLVYQDADAIYLSIDNNRTSWANQPFSWDEKGFQELITKLDIDNKIIKVEEDFHRKDFTPMQNEVFQRNRLAYHMGEGGWHIQLDCDEYFLKFDDFVKYLRRIPLEGKPLNVCCQFITLFKTIGSGFLIIEQKQDLEFMQIATRHPVYEFGRRNGHFNRYCNYKIIHQSWARSDREIDEKLDNWGHKNDFDVEKYKTLWRSLNRNNYKSFRNFHPIDPTHWASMEYFKAASIKDLIRILSNDSFQGLSKIELWLKNSRTLAKLKSLLNS